MENGANNDVALFNDQEYQDFTMNYTHNKNAVYQIQEIIHEDLEGEDQTSLKPKALKSMPSQKNIESLNYN